MAINSIQFTPLHRAITGGHTETCELLIRSGSDVKAVDDEDQSTALHEAAAQGLTGTCERLILSGADVMAIDTYQETPLHHAADRGHAGTCELLIREGADVNAKDQMGTTPLDQAPDQETRRHWKNLEKQAKQERSYHELLQQSGGVKVNRFKVFVGGKETTGKSTLKRSLNKGLLSALIQRLPGRSVDKPHDPTPGVDIGTFHVPGVGEVSVWDFAGQSEYAVTHSMFMDAENTVFIVLYSILDDSETQEKQVHWWLCFIKSCNPNRRPDVILVASHADKVEPTTAADHTSSPHPLVSSHCSDGLGTQVTFNIPQQVLDKPGRRRAARVVQAMQAEFKDHLRIADEVILMDCRKTRTLEMDKLKSLLVRISEALLHHQRDMPRLSAKIMKRLPKWSESKTSPKCPVMMWPDYVSEVKAFNRHVTEDFLDKSTRFLHHLGEVLFITPATSDHILVLKPNWLGTDVFGPIMAPDNFPISHRLRTSRDFVTRAEIQEVFQDVADVDLLITLLQEFQLCHSYNGREFIFPGLLMQTMPPDKWQLTQEPKVVYFGKQVQCADSTDMFSSGFFPRVQTRLMRGLENRPLLWRDGAKCADRNVEGLIKLSPDGREVNICVRSAQGDKVQCGKMLQQLENIIADVLDECSPGTGTVEKVLSARALKEHREEFYSYGKKEISKAASEGDTIVHPTLGFTEQVSDLLCVVTPLTRYRPELVKALGRVEPILDRLLSRGILGDEDRDCIRAKETPQDKTRELLDIVGRKGERASRVFKAILEQVHPHAAEMIKEGRLCGEDEDPLIKNRPQLVQELKYVVEPILTHLLSRGILSDEECDIIKANRTRHDKARELLDIVGRKGKVARQVFKEVLEEVSPHLAEMVA
ncbi:DAPK1 [Branchiostoma lanceolatum]|nr:DAPK1 [Branchiostoma lanceolatum]